MAKITYGDGHPQWEDTVTHMITDIDRSEVEVSVTKKLSNIISGALKSPEGEFPLTEYFYNITKESIEIYDRYGTYLVTVGIGSFTDEEIEWIKNNLPLFDTGEDYQDESMIKLEFKKWKNEWWNVFRTNGSQFELIGYVRPLLPHLILPYDLDSDDGPTPKHYFEDRYDNTVVTEHERKLINEFIMRQVGDVSVTDIRITPNPIEVYVMESVYVDAKTRPTWATNPGVHLTTSDSSIATMEDDNVVIGVSEGACDLIATTDEVNSEGEPVFTRRIRIDVLQLYELINTIYPIKTDSEGHKYITKLNPDTRVSEFDESFRNNVQYIHIYNKYGNDVTNDPVEIVQTGMYVELLIDGTLYDRVDVVVPGDVNGDGVISSNDLTTFNRHYNHIEELTYPYTIAADINEDGKIDVSDRDMLINHINTGRF